MNAAADQHRASGPRLLHVFSTFNVGGPQVRFSQLANGLDTSYHHDIIAMDGGHKAAALIEDTVSHAIHTVTVHKGAGISPANLASFRRFLRERRPDVLLTYNWGAIEWALANRLFPLVPHLHFEDGFGPDETGGRQNPKRVFMRKLALTGGTRVIVPSRTLESIALDIWRLRKDRITYIPNGIDCEKFASAAPAESVRLDGNDIVIGTVGILRAEKNLHRLLHLFSALRQKLPARLVIVGDGSERPGLEAEANRLGITQYVNFIGHSSAPEHYYRAMDVFALTSDTEQMPYSVIEAMAAGCPVLATDVGDVRGLVAEDNQRFVISPSDEDGLLAALTELSQSQTLRSRLGDANQELARSRYDLGAMITQYDSLFRDPRPLR